MSIKQKVKKLASIFGLLTMIITPATVAVTAYADTSCGGVATTIIGCPDQKGSCPGDSATAIAAYVKKYGNNNPSSYPYLPNEGSDPGTDSTAKTAYKNAYGHAYGKCLDGSTPGTDTTQSGIWGILLYGINILTAGVGIAAVGGIVYGSILYTTSQGNEDQTKKAIEFIRNVIIGLIAYGLMFAVLNFIIPGGLFDS